jgi:hypothetical protein
VLAPAASHQLRILRHLGLVVGERRGRSVIYALHDSHVADLLDQAVFHIEHLRLGYPEPIKEASRATISRTLSRSGSIITRDAQAATASTPTGTGSSTARSSAHAPALVRS